MNRHRTHQFVITLTHNKRPPSVPVARQRIFKEERQTGFGKLENEFAHLFRHETSGNHLFVRAPIRKDQLFAVSDVMYERQI